MNTWARGYTAFADDLSGAAETAAALAAATGWRAAVVLASDGLTDAADGEIRCVDLHLRGRTRSDVLERMTAAVAGGGERLLMKVDSLYRGDIGGYAAALSGGVTIVAPSLPALGRTLVDGRPLVAGLPLAESAAAATWAHEPGTPPRHVSELLPEGHEPIPLDVVRSAGLADALADARSRLLVCDAVTEEDLDAIVAASWDLPRVRYLGSGGLAGAIGRKLAASVDEVVRDEVRDADTAGRILVVVGSAEATARAQLESLGPDVPIITSPPDDAVGETTDRVIAAMALTDTVALIVPAEAVAGGAERIATSLARTVAASLAHLDGTSPVGLVLVGGHSARTILDELGTTALSVIREVHRGAVLSRADDGRLVTTRPGSFGDIESLRLIITAMNSAAVGHQWKNRTP